MATSVEAVETLDRAAAALEPFVAEVLGATEARDQARVALSRLERRVSDAQSRLSDLEVTCRRANVQLALSTADVELGRGTASGSKELESAATRAHDAIAPARLELERAVEARDALEHCLQDFDLPVAEAYQRLRAALEGVRREMMAAFVDELAAAALPVAGAMELGHAISAAMGGHGYITAALNKTAIPDPRSLDRYLIVPDLAGSITPLGDTAQSWRADPALSKVQATLREAFALAEAVQKEESLRVPVRQPEPQRPVTISHGQLPPRRSVDELRKLHAAVMQDHPELWNRPSHYRQAEADENHFRDFEKAYWRIAALFRTEEIDTKRDALFWSDNTCQWLTATPFRSGNIWGNAFIAAALAHGDVAVQLGRTARDTYFGLSEAHGRVAGAAVPLAAE